MAKRIFVLAWTPNKTNLYGLKKEAVEQMKVWRDYKRDAGWAIKNVNNGEAYIASKNGEREAIILREYDPVTRQRIYPKCPKRATSEV